MSKKPLGEQLNEAIIEYVLIFVVLCALAIPLAIVKDGLTGAAGLIFIVVIFAICMLSAKSDEKKSNKNNYEIENNSSNNRLKNTHIHSEYNPKKKKCPNCGKEVADFALVCKYCKTKFKTKPKTNVATNNDKKNKSLTTYEYQGTQYKTVKIDKTYYPPLPSGLKRCPSCNEVIKRKNKRCTRCGYEF